MRTVTVTPLNVAPSAHDHAAGARALAAVLNGSGVPRPAAGSRAARD